MMKLVLAAVVLVACLQGSSAYFPSRQSSNRQEAPPPPPPPTTEDPDFDVETEDPDSLWWMDKQRNDNNNNNNNKPNNPGNGPNDGNGPDEEWDGPNSGPAPTSGKKPNGGNGRRPQRRPSGSRTQRRPSGRRPQRTQVDPPSNGGEWEDEEWNVDNPAPDHTSNTKPTGGNGNRNGREPSSGRQPQRGSGRQPQRGSGRQPQRGPGRQPQRGSGSQPDGRQPQRGPGRQPQRGSGRQPQRGPGRQPQRGSGRQPQRGPGRQPQRGPQRGPKPSRGNPYGRPNNNNNNNNNNGNDDNRNTDECSPLADEGSCMFYNHPQCFQRFLTGCRPYPFQAEIVCTRSEQRTEFINEGIEYIEEFRRCTIDKLRNVDDCDAANANILQGVKSPDCISQNNALCDVILEPQNCEALFHIFGFSETGNQGELQDELFDSLNRFVGQCPQAAQLSYANNFSSKFFGDQFTTTPMMNMMGAGGD